MLQGSESLSSHRLVLNGLDGTNPLGFMAAVGVMALLNRHHPNIRMGWLDTGGNWHPTFEGCGANEQDFIHNIVQALHNSPDSVLDIDKGMPFNATTLASELRKAQDSALRDNRYDSDLLAAFGCELYADEKGHFKDTYFRMVRSGDSNGQGLPYYAKQIRKSTGPEQLRRSMFAIWDYSEKGYSLRWDPSEDRRYALRWGDPSKQGKADSGIMLAANCLAVEALHLFPTFLVGRDVQTTGFVKDGRYHWFVWPIWTPLVDADVLRSILSLPLIRQQPLDRKSLLRIGIAEVYGCQRIFPTQHYRNFLPSIPR